MSAQPHTLPPRSDAQMRQRFHHHFAKWSAETAVVSNYNTLLSHPSYLAILGLGLPAVPLLLEELSKGGGGPLIAALEAITGENPIPPEHESDAAVMVADWLAWGKAHGII
jgi:hypothetical protein